MQVLEWLQFIIGTLVLLSGLFLFAILRDLVVMRRPFQGTRPRK